MVELDPEGGEQIMSALQAIVDSEVKERGVDLRTSRQLRADALVELARRYLDCKDRPSAGGERPHLTVTVDLHTLRDSGNGTPTLDNAGSVAVETARRLACDASVRRVIFNGSEPMDVGRKNSVVLAAIRRAVVARDKTCRFSGCRRPPAWCDVHHIKHWAKGGETSISNCVLLCRRHHRLLHEEGFSAEMADGIPVFRRPDGSVIENNRAPP